MQFSFLWTQDNWRNTWSLRLWKCVRYNEKYHYCNTNVLGELVGQHLHTLSVKACKLPCDTLFAWMLSTPETDLLIYSLKKTQQICHLTTGKCRYKCIIIWIWLKSYLIEVPRSLTQYEIKYEMSGKFVVKNVCWQPYLVKVRNNKIVK